MTAPVTIPATIPVAIPARTGTARPAHSARARLPLATLIGALAALGQPVWAEQLALEEIVVTAQKRQQTLEEVPISIAAFSGERLAEAGLNTVNDLPTAVPGMRIDQQGNFSQPTVRGVGSSTAGAGFTSNVATYVDGFYVPSQLGTDMQLLNLASVQVLKGPQGTLFGRNATGGAILLETQDPTFEPRLEAKLAAGNYGKTSTNLYASTGLTDTLAVDIAAMYESGDGYMDDLVNGDDEIAAYDRQSYRISGLLEASDSLQIELALSHADTDDPLYNTKGAWEGHTLARLLDPANLIVADGHLEVSNTAPIAGLAKSDGAYLTIEKTFANDILLKSFTMARRERNFSSLDLDSSNIPVFGVEYTTKNKALTQEFNLSGETGRLEWILGAFWMDYREDFYHLAATEFPFVIYDNIGNDMVSSAVFADGTYQVTDDFFLTLGLRYSQEQADAFYKGQYLLGDAEWDGDWSSTTPRVVGRYQLNDDSSVYVSYSQGFKAGLLNPSGFSPVPVDQEEIDAWEIGYKANWGSVRLDAAAFYYDYQDMQVSSYNGTQALVVNAASSTIKGAEFQLTTLLGEGLEVNLGAAWTDANYEEFPGSQPRDLDPTSPTYMQILAGNAAGNPMIRSPELSATFGVTYERPLPVGALRLNGNYYYTDEFYFDPNQQFLQEAYGLLSLRATWIAPGEQYTVALFGNNLTDEEYLNQVLPGDQTIGQGYGEPLTWGVEFGVKL